MTAGPGPTPEARRDQPGFPRRAMLAAAMTHMPPGDVFALMSLYDHVAGRVADRDFVLLMRMAEAARHLTRDAAREYDHLQAGIRLLADLLIERHAAAELAGDGPDEG